MTQALEVLVLSENLLISGRMLKFLFGSDVAPLVQEWSGKRLGTTLGTWKGCLPDEDDDHVTVLFLTSGRQFRADNSRESLKREEA